MLGGQIALGVRQRLIGLLPLLGDGVPAGELDLDLPSLLRGEGVDHLPHALGLFAPALAAKVREQELKSLVDNINASVDALERLFSAMMDISKLDAGAVEPVRCVFPLAPLFARVDAAFAQVAAARGLRLRVVATRTWVESDPLLLERILFNLVSNAVRYTEHGGAVLGVRRR